MKFILILLPLFAIATLAKSQAVDSTIPYCIQQWLQNPDSLIKSNVISIKKILLHGQQLYYVERLRPKKTTNIPPPYSIWYVDSTGHTVASMTIGGAIGMRVTPGYSYSDFPPKKIIQTLWVIPPKQK